MAVLIDVRTKAEYDEDHAPEAVHLPLVAIACGNLGILTTCEKTDRVELYCRSGGRAEQAREHLIRQGYMDVVNRGGLADVQQCTDSKKENVKNNRMKTLWNHLFSSR